MQKDVCSCLFDHKKTVSILPPATKAIIPAYHHPCHMINTTSPFRLMAKYL